MDDAGGYIHSYDDEHPFHVHDDDDGPGDGCGYRSGGRTASKRKRRRKEARRRTASNNVTSPTTAILDLTVCGTACRLHQDDALAHRIDEGNHLINYFEDRIGMSDCEESDDDSGCCFVHDDEAERHPADGKGEDGATRSSGRGKEHVSSCMQTQSKIRTLMMDRYDVRTLLDDLTSLRGQQRRIDKRVNAEAAEGSVSATQREHLTETINAADMQDGLTEAQIEDINFDRFGALPEYRQIFISQDDQVLTRDSAKGKVSETEEPFDLTEEEAKGLPKGMIVPSTKRQKNVIELTAQRANSASQFEVLLKVKQASNPDFAFLYPGHTLYPYYAWIRQRDNKIMGSASEEPEGASSSSSDEDSGKGFSGLLAMYSSSGSDEDESTDRKAKGSTTADSHVASSSLSHDTTSNSTRPFSDTAHIPVREEDTSKLATEERRAVRLRKAQQLKAHFASRLNRK